ncbi:VCBS repeat-containing protein [Sphingomonas sp. DG1-23]|uniref:FG-GAP repeat domain-containing protein n=1 Tax=Sphingomonas sp. DG1-23 TaxID=3068316 RepID=UPI00273EF112|nr:VCBS repeat-containing protein [Sphingomonas sp. DG1-23]MDP5281370.1 VCBS repeat-containing protein [Sphingomonas sp. DG1-23]
MAGATRIPAFDDPIFRAVQPGGSEASSQRLAVADFDQDGNLDMLVAHVASVGSYTGQVAFLRGKGDGSFEAPANIISGNTVGTQIAVGDVNGDGLLDLAVQGVLNFSSDGAPSNTYLKVLLGNGSGAFTEISQRTTYKTSQSALTLRDVNDDGRSDIVALSAVTTPNSTVQHSLVVRLADMDGLYPEARYYLLPGRGNGLVVGDVNGDGKSDTVVATAMGYSVLLGDGEGSFQAPINTVISGGVSTIAAGDFNGDGKIDLAIGKSTAGLSILLGNGNGGFQQSQNLATPAAPTSIQAADLNGDGRLDLVTTSNSGPSMFVNNGAAFQPHADFLLPINSAVAIGDFDNNGGLDMAATTHTPDKGVLVYLQDGVTSRYAVSDDFDGDGRSDILRRHINGTTDIMLMQTLDKAGGGNTASQTSNAWKIQDTGDFNGDGRSDIFWRTDSGAFAIWMLDGTQDVAHRSGNVRTVWKMQDVADFNGDGTSDVLWRHDDGTSYIWFMNNGVAVSSGNTSSQTGSNWQVQAAADFDGDGKGDILWRKADGTTHIWFMDGYQAKSSSGNTASQLDLNWKFEDAADFNGDGKADILWRHTDGTTRIWLMDGKTQIGGGNTASQTGNAWQFEKTGDYNGDGKADILWRHSDGSTYVWLMDGTDELGSGYVNPPIASDWHII